ncbi:PREDICTED: arrestin domain-containing protein 2-like [Wasmannia auropunctata]|uniref:arrestin domain-containing protein 2-like n=1 Tax=Wasmannia auropunctata TaxID=64793 RepID=UPI0005F0B13F|nr:PREDICTED: arrestin domain-containing protein 2-like [Wasmannia auropunctata]
MSTRSLSARSQLSQVHCDRKMPSLNNFHIEFDQPSSHIYKPGEIVSGYVIIGLAKEKLAEALKLTAKGEAKVSWDETSSTTDSDGNSTTTTYSGTELYFSVNILLLESSDDGKVHLPAGLSRYPFCIQLPHNIPCNFEDRVGHVRYTIHAIIVRPWRFNHKCKVALTINTPYDLNIRREQCIGISEEISETFSCCCCLSSDTVNAHIKVPMTGFVPGQWLEVFFELKDTAVIAALQKICVKLQKALEYRANVSRKRVRTTVASVHKQMQSDKLTDFTLRILVPSTPSSELEFCNIINLKYILRIGFHSSKTYPKIVREYPILIGTIPLQSLLLTPAISASPPILQYTSNEEVTAESNIASAPPLYEECYMKR